MNRRAFLRFLLALPVVGPAAINAALAAPAPVRQLVFGPFEFVSDDAALKRLIWLEMPRDLYWANFMKDDATIELVAGKRGDQITMPRIKRLSGEDDA